jgi:tagatose-6-phosphate ketose/aldose isomerase
MKYLGIETVELNSGNGLNTAMEISGQPALWKKVFNQFSARQHEIASYLEDCLRNVDKIILSGSGTSSYVGLALEGLFFRSFAKNVSVVSGTDIVTHPENYFSDKKPVLLVSFARSGNSPESLATVELADRFSSKCYHLIITCNVNGALANYEAKHSKFVIVLPPESNDKALAMTGSYTGMLLSGILVAYIFDLKIKESQVETLCKYGEMVISDYAIVLKKIAEKDFKRAVFLGSGPFFSSAMESHLKLQELTDGNVVCKCDSFLGLRHGPKVVIHEDTLVVYLFSNHEHVYQYERDLAKAIEREHNPIGLIGVGQNLCTDVKMDLIINFSDSQNKLCDELLAVCNVLPAQMLGFFKSLALGLMPDSPSKNHVISRVVTGVKIYDYVSGAVKVHHKN